MSRPASAASNKVTQLPDLVPQLDSSSFQLPYDVFCQKSHFEYTRYGQDYSGRKMEALVREVGRKYSWIDEEELGNVVGEATRYPLLQSPQVRPLYDLTAENRDEPSTAFHTFTNSVPEDFVPSKNDDNEANEGDRLTLEHINEDFDRIEKSLAIELSRVEKAKETIWKSTTSLITLPFTRMIVPQSSDRTFGDYDFLRRHRELLVDAESPSHKPSSSTKNYFVLSLARISQAPPEWNANNPATIQEVQNLIQSLVVAGFTAAVNAGLPLDRVYVVPAVQVAGLGTHPNQWQLFNPQIIPPQFQAVTHLHILHYFDLIVMFGSTGAGLLFFDYDLLVNLLDVLRPRPPNPPNRPIPPGPPPLPRPPRQAPQNPPRRAPDADDSEDTDSSEDSKGGNDDEDAKPPKPESDDENGRNGEGAGDKHGGVGDRAATITTNESNGGNGRRGGEVIKQNHSISGGDGDGARPEPQERSREDSGDGNRTETMYRGPWKSTAQFCFIVTEKKSQVKAYWSSVSRFASALEGLLTNTTNSDSETTMVIRDLMAHFEGREEFKKKCGEGMKRAQEIVRRQGISSWRFRNSAIQRNISTVPAAGASTKSITASTLAASGNLSQRLPQPRPPSSTRPRPINTHSDITSRDRRSLSSSSASHEDFSLVSTSDSIPKPPFLFTLEQLYDHAIPSSLLPEEKELLRAYPSPDSLSNTSKRRPPYGGPTLSEYVSDLLNDEEEEEVLRFVNFKGKKRALRCDDCDDSFHVDQRNLLEFHKFYHSKYRNEMANCVRCFGQCPLRFMRAHINSCDGQLNHGLQDVPEHRKNDFVYWFKY